MVQATNMIPVAMRQDDKIKSREIDTERPDVVGKVIAVVSRVEQHPLASVLDQGRIAPASFQGRRLSECVVQNGYLIHFVSSVRDAWTLNLVVNGGPALSADLARRLRPVRSTSS
jgi:hypothetical protein